MDQLIPKVLFSSFVCVNICWRLLTNKSNTNPSRWVSIGPTLHFTLTYHIGQWFFGLVNHWTASRHVMPSIAICQVSVLCAWIRLRWCKNVYSWAFALQDIRIHKYPRGRAENYERRGNDDGDFWPMNCVICGWLCTYADRLRIWLSMGIHLKLIVLLLRANAETHWKQWTFSVHIHTQWSCAQQR